MARKLSDIENEIQASSAKFYQHLRLRLGNDVWYFLDELMSRTNVFVFSGVIRNYFIGRKFEPLRDVDFLIQDFVDIENLFPELKLKINSYGGYKIEVGNMIVDLWVVNKTWGLNTGQLKLSFDLVRHLPNTTFFNFSSVLYDLNERCFIIGKPFLQFLRDKKMDVVFMDNPHPGLCIVNSFYYSDKFKLKMTDKLVRYILENYKSNIDTFEIAQNRHFGSVIYKREVLLDRIKKLEVAKVEHIRPNASQY